MADREFPAPRPLSSFVTRRDDETTRAARIENLGLRAQNLQILIDQQQKFRKLWGQVAAGADLGLLGDNAGEALTYVLEPLGTGNIKEALNRLEPASHSVANAANARKAARTKITGVGVTGNFPGVNLVTRSAQAITSALIDIIGSGGIGEVTPEGLAVAREKLDVPPAAEGESAFGPRNVSELGDLRGMIFERLATGQSDTPEQALAAITSMSPERRAAARFSSNFNDIMGVPKDQFARAEWRRQVPASAKLVRFASEMGALMYLTRGLGVSGRGLAATKGIRGFLARSSPGLGRARIPNIGLLGAAGGATLSALNYNVNVMQGHTEFSGMEAATQALTGAGWGFFLTTALLGRPFGAQAHAFHRASVGAQSGNLLGRFKTFGLAHRFSPRLTVGYMMESGALGAGFIAMEELGKGKPADEAIKTGALSSGAWIGLDLAFSRFGSMARWGATVANMRPLMVQAAESIGRSRLNPTGRLTTRGGVESAANVGESVTNVLGAATAGAAVGAGIGAVTGQDTMSTAIGGAVGALAGGGYGLTFKARMSPLMSNKLRIAIDRLLSCGFQFSLLGLPSAALHLTAKVSIDI